MSFRSDVHDWIRDTLNVPTRAIRLSDQNKPMLPAVTYNLIFEEEPISHSGRTGLVRHHMQIDVWAGNDAEVDTLATTLRRLLNGFRGVIGSTEIAQVEFAGQQDLPGSDTRQFRRAIDFYFVERELGVAES